VDYYTICAQRALISDSFTGKTLDTVRIFNKNNVFLGFDNDAALKLSGAPDMPYLHTVEKRYIPVRNAHDWHLAKFSGKTLTAVDINPGDRVLSFRFNSGFKLIFEMTGRYANIIVVNKKGIIAGSTRTITRHMSGFREICPGAEYLPPPVRSYYDLVWGALPVLESRLKSSDTEIKEALAVQLCAGSRLLAGEAIAQCGLDEGLTPAELSADDLFRLFKTMATIISRIETGGDGGTVIYGADGLPRDVFPGRMESSGAEDVYHESIDQAVISYSRSREHGLELKQNKQSILSTLSRERKRLRATIVKIERESGGDADSGILDHKGNTILANLRHVTKGMKSVSLPDLYGSGENITIELNPALGGPGNAQRFFSRARKVKTASKLAEERIEGLRRRIEKIDTELERYESLDDLKELRKASEKVSRQGAPGRAYDADQPFPRRFTSISGLEIIVGRNDKENDALVRWARKNDIWLHAQNIGGSHVILRSPGKQNPDHRSIEEAAGIAAYFSKAKTSSVVPVAWTRVKYVVKRKGQGPGQVRYTMGKVLFVEPVLPGKKNG